MARDHNIISPQNNNVSFSRDRFCCGPECSQALEDAATMREGGGGGGRILRIAAAKAVRLKQQELSCQSQARKARDR